MYEGEHVSFMTKDELTSILSYFYTECTVILVMVHAFWFYMLSVCIQLFLKRINIIIIIIIIIIFIIIIIITAI